MFSNEIHTTTNDFQFEAQINYAALTVFYSQTEFIENSCFRSFESKI